MATADVSADNAMKVGLLPLYLELYDRRGKDRREPLVRFYNSIQAELEKRGAVVVPAEVCRLASEFDAAISAFEKADVDAIVTLHLAYSPSLESADALSRTKLPIVVLDTTPDFDFSPEQGPDAIMFNHGIHGVQDMCNLLIRRGKQFAIEVGHWQESDVLDRITNIVAGHRIARAMRTARVGRIGEAFQGMGDFSVPPAVLRNKIGMQVVPYEPSRTAGLLPAEADPEVSAEMEADAKRFAIRPGTEDGHRHSVRAGLAVRKWIQQENLTGITFNFLAFDGTYGFPTVPFLEASKAMSRGIGYAGEGDVLTSALVGSLATVYPETTFTEAFCPDWKNGSLFMSHMGEVNSDLLAGTPTLLVNPFVWSDIADPAVALGRLKGGDGCLVNCAPGPDDTFTLVIALGRMLDVPGEDKLEDTVHGWFEPQMNLPEFLKAYSQIGGTHHSAFSYGANAATLREFGLAMGWSVAVIGGSTTRHINRRA